MSRIIINVLLVILLILLSFFGVGPILFADGTGTERMYTIYMVGFLYLLIFAILYYVNKRMRK